MDHDDGKPADTVLARPKEPRVIYRFSCGDGPCRVARIIDGTSRRLVEHPELPAPPEDDPPGG